MDCQFLQIMKTLITVLVSLSLLVPELTKAAIKDGAVKLTAKQLQPGSTLELTGQWLYRPGYGVQAGETPEIAAGKGCVQVPVPQLLNRIYWWLDDSEDFKKHETARLKALGFDTERAEDGWYYLKVTVPQIPDGKHVFIEFDGIAMVSRTYCNGKLLGEHKGMFSRFEYDLTPHLRSGENLIAVFVSMEKIPPSSLSMGEAVTVNLTASKVKTMSKGMFGPLSPNFDNRAYDLHGIWQPAKLVVRGKAKLDDVWFVPSLDGAEVKVEARSLTGAQTANFMAQWTDLKTGRPFAESTVKGVTLSANPVSRAIEIRNVKPQLWTPAKPNLYRLDVKLVTDAGEVLDSWTQNVGFRTFEARGNQFLLNGKPYWLRGANHLPYGKNPFDPMLARRLIQSLHDANVGITRTHATPWNEAWLDAADEIGLAVSLEGIRPWALAGKIGATPPDIFAHWLMENEDVVKRARNHPSVFIYTVGNEMLLRDTKNVEKWQQLSDIVKQTRKVDPTRPVICSSEYAREAETYNELLKPNGIDDGDADDLHRYNNWYGPSSFVTDAKLEKEIKANGGTRPLIGQEMSSGYPDLDNGLPVLRYTRDLVTPQAWVGNYSYPGNDPKYFLEHHRAVTKRWAERLRFERGTNTAGFMLFAAECWFSHSYDAATLKPYPAVEAVREAFAPIGLALETGRRRFMSGEELETAVFISNDDESHRDLTDLKLEWMVVEKPNGKGLTRGQPAAVTKLAFHATEKAPVRIKFPEVSHRRSLALQCRLMQGNKEISRTTDNVEVMPSPKPAKLEAPIFARGLGQDLNRFLEVKGVRSSGDLSSAQVLLVGAKDGVTGLAVAGSIRKAIEAGATAIVFSPGEKFTSLFPKDILDAKASPGEFADFAPCAGTALAEQLAPMDLKWWGRKDDWRVFVADTSHRLKSGGSARELIRYIPAHSYISADKVPEQYRTVMFEIPLGRGRLWVCDLDFEASVSIDPAAQQFALNLIRAAADKNSTSKLPTVPSHEELLGTAK